MTLTSDTTRTQACRDKYLDVEHVFERLPPLRLSEARRFREHGVPLDALLKPEHVARHRVAFHPQRPRFDFSDDGQPAFVFMAKDGLGEAVDLVAWSGPTTGRLASWQGRAAMLGADTCDDVVTVFPDPLEWLLGGRVGLVLIPQPNMAQTRARMELVS